MKGKKYSAEQIVSKLREAEVLLEAQSGTGVERPEGELPTAFSLEQNYPNPFNPGTTIRFALPEQSHVTLTVFTALGQQVATLVEGEMEAGYHEATFDASDLATGVYIYRLSSENYVQARKLVLVR